MVPHVLRTHRMMSWMNALVSPVVTVYNLFLRYRNAKLYQLGITPQVCFLEKMLNDRFDPQDRRIYIGDGLRYDPIYIFQDDEEKPIWLYDESEAQPVYLYTDGETLLNGDDFIVYVNVLIPFNEIEMKALLNSYKLAGKRYKIQVV
jgi:hypothetical protein